jgi:alpha-ketoglutarate-dependent taurine dioxygenase
MLEQSELNSRGWAAVSGVRDEADLIELARSLGRPVASPTGEILKQLVPRSAAHAGAGTLSAAHGRGPFPLHTDTAFWPAPSRLLLFRAKGDLRRSTTLLSISRLLRELGHKFEALACRSIWLIRTPRRSFYSSMVSFVGDQKCWRYDATCMSPANRAAHEVSRALEDATPSVRPELFQWREGVALIVSNWNVLHGRGPSPSAERVRILERIYVE